MKGLGCFFFALVVTGQAHALYQALLEYSGATFFDKWDYYGFVDNTTWGNVTYQDRANATSKGLTTINGAGNAIIKVDNTTTLVAGPPNTVVNRASIRITSQDSYGLGTLVILDALHIPYGCSVWPSFWTLGLQETWPGAGEIDIVEAINGMTNNQIALHTPSGCFQGNVQSPLAQTGSTANTDCSEPRGCIVTENKADSFGEGFAAAGGGVYAMQMDVSGVYVWFWSRADIPANIKSATSTSTMDMTAWGLPSAAYPTSGCNITQFFPPQNLVLLTTLCGAWAGVPSIYASTCHTPTGSCFADNILGNGSNYADAYWEIQYIRTYTADTNLPTSSSSSGQSTTLVTVVTTASQPASTNLLSSAAMTRSGKVGTLLYALVLLLGLSLLL